MENVELNEKRFTNSEDYNEKLERKLQMIYEKMLDVEEKIIREQMKEEEEEIKRQQHEIECHKRDLEYRRNTLYEHNRRNIEIFRKGYWS